jgi:hypothetical protein
MQYTDIGHSDPDDMLWILHNDKLDVVKRVTSAGGEPWTHWTLWGGEMNECWRGRYEARTGFCSLSAPRGDTGSQPPAALLETLKARFRVAAFYFFPDGASSAVPC